MAAQQGCQQGNATPLPFIAECAVRELTIGLTRHVLTLPSYISKAKEIADSVPFSMTVSKSLKVQT